MDEMKTLDCFLASLSPRKSVVDKAYYCGEINTMLCKDRTLRFISVMYSASNAHFIRHSIQVKNLNCPKH